MKYKTHSIITDPHKYEITFFAFKKDTEDYRNSYIEIHFAKNDKLKKLKFLQPVKLKIESGFNGQISGMEILDIRSCQLENVGVDVQNFEQDPGITFMAREVIEVSD